MWIGKGQGQRVEEDRRRLIKDTPCFSMLALAFTACHP